MRGRVQPDNKYVLLLLLVRESAVTTFTYREAVIR
jgi:hypothetical protein